MVDLHHYANYGAAASQSKHLWSVTMRANPEKLNMFVSFSGMDGAGKSTQIASLRAHMEEAGLRVRIITFWDDVARLIRLRAR